MKPGKSFGGCVLYCVNREEATILDADGVRISEAAHTIADFNMQRKINPALGQAVGHIALNWNPSDKPKLTDEMMVSIAKEYLQGMKIVNTQFLLVKHTDKEHPHIHIVYNRVNNEGKTISDSMQRWQNVKVSKALTVKYDLHISEGKKHVNRQQLKGLDKLKYQLYDTISHLIPMVKSMDDLQQQLAKQGIGMLYKYKSGTNEIQGISFSIGEYKFKGSEIDRSLSYGKIKQIIDQKLERQVKEKQQAQQPHKTNRVLNPWKTDQSIHISKPSILETLLKQENGDMPAYPDLIKKKKRKKDLSQNQGVHL